MKLKDMARYNHFKELPYHTVMFKDIKIGDKFRLGKYKKDRHSFVIAVKTGDKTYVEQQSKKMVTLFAIVGFHVYVF